MRLRLVLVGTEGEVNLGFIVRLAANFRVDEVYLVSPRIDPYSEVVRRYAAKGAHLIPRIKLLPSLADALKGIDIAACTSSRIGQRSDVLRHPVDAREFAERIAPRYGNVAVVFGRESVGLTREEISLCHLLVHIPANPDYPVLNLSHAVAIILYELWLAREGCQRVLVEEARAEAYSHIYNLLYDIAKRVVEEERLEAVEAAIKHLLWRCGLTAGEAAILYYFFKKISRLARGEHYGVREDRHPADNKPWDRGHCSG